MRLIRLLYVAQKVEIIGTLFIGVYLHLKKVQRKYRYTCADWLKYNSLETQENCCKHGNLSPHYHAT